MLYFGIPPHYPHTASRELAILRYAFIAAVVFTANAALLVLQLSAGRLLSPFVGSSLATWTAVIGVFFAGISAGNWVGGRLADRCATSGLLRCVLLAGAASVAWTLVLKFPVLDGLIRSVPLSLRIAVLTTVVCFPAAFTLSLTTPVAIKLLLPNVGKLGRVAGAVYALGTLGSLAGNFATGLYLAAVIGTTATVAATAGVVALLALLTPPRMSAHESTSAAIAEPCSAGDAVSLGEACLIVFAASFASMSLEITASRLLAPDVGVSLYSWTGIIGVVLAGIVAGNTLGGRIADRSPYRRTLGRALFWCGFFTLASLALYMAAAGVVRDQPSRPLAGWGGNPFSGEFWRGVNDWSRYQMFEWLKGAAVAGPATHVLIYAIPLFFVPMVAFGTISPLATRLASSDWQSAGRAAGRVYACSCLGAIVGTFAAGWWLIGAFGVMRLIFAVGLGMIVLSRPSRQTVLLALIVGALIGGDPRRLRFDPDAPYEKETDYFLIRVTNAAGFAPDDPLGEQFTYRNLLLDLLIHSNLRGHPDERNGRLLHVDVGYLGYGHEQVQSEFARWVDATHEEPRVLVIGGGGYTLPRWIDAKLPKVGVDVVEIDPGVTEAVHVALGLPRDTRIRSHHLDGRQFVQERAAPGGYHLVIQDAVNDLSVPAHLMTREYNEAVRRIMTDDSTYLLTVIDEYPEGKFLPAAVRTLKETFAHVYLLADRPHWERPARSVFVIAGRNQPLDWAGIEGAVELAGAGPLRTTAMPEAMLGAYLAGAKPVLLTDDFAPVDNLLAEAYRRRWKSERKEEPKP